MSAHNVMMYGSGVHAAHGDLNAALICRGDKRAAPLDGFPFARPKRVHIITTVESNHFRSPLSYLTRKTPQAVRSRVQIYRSATGRYVRADGIILPLRNVIRMGVIYARACLRDVTFAHVCTRAAWNEINFAWCARSARKRRFESCYDHVRVRESIPRRSRTSERHARTVAYLRDSD